MAEADKDKPFSDFKPELQDISLTRLAAIRNSEEQAGQLANVDPLEGILDRVRAADAMNEIILEAEQSTPYASWVSWLIWLVAVPLLIVLFIFAGMVTGFVLLGEGSFQAAFQWHTWLHLYRLVFA